MVTNSELRARARAALSGNWGMAILAYLIYAIVVGAVSIVDMIPFVGYIVTFVVSAPLALGLFGYFLGLFREGNTNIDGLFSGFKQFGEAFILYLLIAVFVFLWSILLIIPGIIAYYRYSMAFFILKDNPGIGGMEAIRRSKEMMAGHKGRLFLLHLSFIGWFLLCIITVGIGFFFLCPYVYTAMAAFYEDLRGASGNFGSGPDNAFPNDSINV